MLFKNHMNINNINKKYLDEVLEQKKTDFLYHFGISSTDSIIKDLKDLKAIVLTGSGLRSKRMAKTWAKQNNIKEILSFPKKERFLTYYVGNTLFSSHGMGMPSMSIALEELMKLCYFVKKGNTQEIDKIFWARVGTSGGLVEAGSIVISTEGLCANFKPYNLFILGKNYTFNSFFPSKTIKEIFKANKDLCFNIIEGKTIGANTFYLEQSRTDGALNLFGAEEKQKWLKKAEKLGVKNIEMEAPMMAGLLNHWGFSNFTDICCVLVNRLNTDQVNLSKKQLERFSIDAELVLFNYLKKLIP